jgi:hypothetical protein
MKVTIIEGENVTIGDLIGFKLDTEQYGKLIKIEESDNEINLTLEDEGGFDHSIMEGDKTWVVPVSRAWVHEIKQPKKKKIGATTLVNGEDVAIGDEIQFKCDIEQSGKLKSFKTVDGEVELTLIADGCFKGSYIAGDKETTMPASRCWLVD